ANSSPFSQMFVFYDCLWKVSIAFLSVTFTGFRIVEFLSSSIVDIDATKNMAFYSQSIHIVTALLFVISLLSRNTFVTVLTIATLICQSVFTYKHYFARECTSLEVSFTGANGCTNVDAYFEAYNRELFSMYMFAVAAVISILCMMLYMNYLEESFQKVTSMIDPTSIYGPDHPKTSVVSIPSNWSGKRDLLVLRSQRRDSGNFSA
ncbi:hypothetical protein PENTCL1PPCAC_26212, partial [Pristionchus entomophagus]